MRTVDSYQGEENDAVLYEASGIWISVWVSSNSDVKLSLLSLLPILGALLTFAYQGAEVSISGWVTTFLISDRSGEPKYVGYVSGGFWYRITVGRFILGHAAYRIDEKTFVYLLGCSAIGFQLLVWLIPNVIGDAIVVSIVGLLLGPIYPCGQSMLSKLLPNRI
ncbi:hypothetical protein BDZ45DRAFT_751854 [Acephala macrosclerotiorum]|nr:hypothetical protein BDZ45DRAFT_751854 [Acephala macrosclerotiorum]